MEYWLVSIPRESGGRVPDKVKERLIGLSEVCGFNVPQDIKVGTLDILVGLSDELTKLDVFADSITRKLSQYMGDILEEQKSRLSDHLKINEEEISVYVSKFEWDAAKFPIRQSLEQIHANLSEHLSKIDNGLKTKSTKYNQLKGALHALERKQTGSLLTRNLDDLVKKESFVSNSEYLVTLLVVVPKSYTNLWLSKYEVLTEYVVPRSSEQVYDDNEHGLWTVTLFRKIANDFILRAKENRFFVRDFIYDDIKIEDNKKELIRLETEKKKQFQSTFRWLKVNFGEAFIGMVHVKALRIFVESVLRFGLPVNFQSMQIKPLKKNHKKVRELLNQLFGNLESSAMIKFSEADDLPGLNLISQEYYPYVYFKLDVNFTDFIR